MTKIKHFIRVCYLLFRTRLINLKLKAPKVINDLNTIDKIIKENKSVARFGDGEIAIINGGEIGFQKPNSQLAKRLDQVLKDENNDVIVCIPDIYTIEAIKKLTYESKLFWLRELIDNRNIWYSMPKNKVYYDACITRPYIRIKDKKHSAMLFDKLKKVWENKDIMIVEGEFSRLGVGNDLFVNTKSISRILCPSENAFDKYDEILNACLSLDKNTLILLSLGPTATVMAYDLNQNGYQAFDLGHIDLEYEWFLQKATSRVMIKNKAVNELHINNGLEDIEDTTYQNQIIKTIK